jgi:hypothetical protein
MARPGGGLWGGLVAWFHGKHNAGRADPVQPAEKIRTPGRIVALRQFCFAGRLEGCHF